MSKLRKVRITGISEKDACYGNKEKYIGLEGDFLPDAYQPDLPYVSGKFYHETIQSGGCMFFYAVRYKKT